MKRAAWGSSLFGLLITIVMAGIVSAAVSPVLSRVNVASAARSGQQSGGGRGASHYAPVSSGGLGRLS